MYPSFSNICVTIVLGLNEIRSIADGFELKSRHKLSMNASCINERNKIRQTIQEAHGTSLAIEGLFSKLPVRKQRLQASSEIHMFIISFKRLALVHHFASLKLCTSNYNVLYKAVNDFILTSIANLK